MTFKSINSSGSDQILGLEIQQWLLQLSEVLPPVKEELNSQQFLLFVSIIGGTTIFAGALFFVLFWMIRSMRKHTTTELTSRLTTHSGDCRSQDEGVFKKAISNFATAAVDHERDRVKTRWVRSTLLVSGTAIVPFAIFAVTNWLL